MINSQNILIRTPPTHRSNKGKGLEDDGDTIEREESKNKQKLKLMIRVNRFNYSATRAFKLFSCGTKGRRAERQTNALNPMRNCAKSDCDYLIRIFPKFDST